MTTYKIEAGTAQHIGNRPQQNDRVVLLSGARAPGYVLAVLSDGIHGGAGSEQVLHTARLIFDEFKPGERPGLERLSQLLQDIVSETHLVIKMNAVMGGTSGQAEALASFVGLVLSPHGEAVWAHVGDSRLYRVQNGQCMERSNDAAYVQYLMSSERLPEEAARKHRKSTLLLNVMGNRHKEPFLTVGSHTGLAPGDGFLLASDGLWNFFTDSELAAVISGATPRQASEMLINKAQERSQGKGGNCSLAIVKLVQPGPDVAARLR